MANTHLTIRIICQEFIRTVWKELYKTECPTCGHRCLVLLRERGLADFAPAADCLYLFQANMPLRDSDLALSINEFSELIAVLAVKAADTITDGKFRACTLQTTSAPSDTEAYESSGGLLVAATISPEPWGRSLTFKIGLV